MTNAVTTSGRRRALPATVLMLGGVFTALAWLLPGFDVAYGGEGMHVALDAVLATVSLVVAGLAWARFARSRRLSDLAVTAAFAIVVVESAFLLALPTLLNFEQIRPFSVWSSAVTSLVSALLLLGGTYAGGRTIAGRRATWLFVSGVILFLAVTSGIVLTFESRLSLPLNPALSPAAAGRHAFTGDATILAIEAVTGVLLLAAGAKSLLSRQPSDASHGNWLGPALLVAGLAALNYALFPSLYSYWVYTGDILRLAFCVLLTCGIVAELRASVRRAIEVAVLEERRRLARDLHDGVAQELAFIAAEIVDVPTSAHPSLPWIRSAVERALYESRRAIAALTMPLDQPLTAAIAAAAEDITARTGTTLQLDLDQTLEVSPARHETILRVVREAAINAVRHGQATNVRVRLARDPDRSTRLEVADDGTGLDTENVVGGFGLTSMRERVAATGGELQLASTPGAGTRVEALWPAETSAVPQRLRIANPQLTADPAPSRAWAPLNGPQAARKER